METAPTEISHTLLLVYLYAITPPPCTTVYNKHTELPGCCGFLIREPCPPDPSCVSVCLPFLHSLPTQVRLIPTSVQKRTGLWPLSATEHSASSQVPCKDKKSEPRREAQVVRHRPCKQGTWVWVLRILVKMQHSPRIPTLGRSRQADPWAYWPDSPFEWVSFRINEKLCLQ